MNYSITINHLTILELFSKFDDLNIKLQSLHQELQVKDQALKNFLDRTKQKAEESDKMIDMLNLTIENLIKEMENVQNKNFEISSILEKE